MRCPSLLVIVTFVSIATAAATPAIEWNPARPLTWDDFLGAVPARIDASRVAESNTSISWSYRYEVEWQRQRCVFRIVSIDSTTGFHPDSSWARPEHRTPAVLEHEQGHFDITRIYQQRFAETTRELVGVSRECGGGRRARVARNIEREIDRLAGSVYDAIWQQQTKEQNAYDRETNHGIDSQIQTEWTNRIAAQLDR
jgi:hypothetical protein